MDLSKLIHGFLGVVIWICQSCYMDLFKLLHIFVKVVLCFSRSLPIKTKLKFAQDFKACWSFCFEIMLLDESDYSMPWVRSPCTIVWNQVFLAPIRLEIYQTIHGSIVFEAKILHRICVIRTKVLRSGIQPMKTTCNEREMIWAQFYSWTISHNLCKCICKLILFTFMQHFPSECIYLYLKEIGKELYLDWIESLNSEWREGGGLCTETQSAKSLYTCQNLHDC